MCVCFSTPLMLQVNIAQFHPFAGHGIVYGTKRGKIRTFSKT